MVFEFAATASVPWSYLLYGVLGCVLPWQAGLLVDRLWWRPRRLERTLRAQGVGGTTYRFLMGDLKDFGRLNDEAWSKPLPIGCHDIVPRVIPFLYNNVRDHGKPCFSWFGPVANVAITDPELVKDVLSNKFGHFEKPQFKVLTKLLANGLTTHEGEKWVKHRRILNPDRGDLHCVVLLPICESCRRGEAEAIQPIEVEQGEGVDRSVRSPP